MKLFTTLSLKLKLLSGFLFMSILIAAVGILGTYYNKKIIEKYSHITNINLIQSSQLGLMAGAAKDVVRYVGKIGHDQMSKNDFDQLYKDINLSFTTFDSADNNYKNLSLTSKQENKYKELITSWGKFKNIANEMITLSKSGKPEETRKIFKIYYSDLEESGLNFFGVLKSLEGFQSEETTFWVAEAQNVASVSSKLSFFTILVGILFGISCGLLISLSITKSIQRIASQLASNSNLVSLAAVKIASTSEELSQATTEQAAALQETSSSIEEISSMVNANTENAKQSSTISEQSLSTAQKGKLVVEHMINAIGDINTSNNGIIAQINETNKEIENIVKIINEIGNKTKVINDIVFQTKLLSFNASVEAARAGEQGKGFAVVAEEVGNLAAMSGAAALEITNMLDGSIKTVEAIVRDSKDKIGKLIINGKEKVEIGTRVAHECEEVLNEIVSSVASAARMVTEISTASQEQAQGVHEITKAISQLDQVTQQNTSNSAQSASAAADLSSQANLLNSLVLELVQTVKGGELTQKSPETTAIKKMEPKVNGSQAIRTTNTEPNFVHKKGPKAELANALLSKNSLPSSNDKRFEDV